MADATRAQSDSQHDFQSLYVQHMPAITAFFRKRRFSPEDARDLAQDTFVRAFRGWGAFRGEAPARIWLLRIAANVWRNALRSRSAVKRDGLELPLDDHATRTRVEAESSTTGPRGDAPPFDAVWTREVGHMVHTALRGLPPQMQRCMVLHVTRDLEHREIAAVLKISIGAVKSHLHAARQRLRRQLDRELDGGAP